MAREQAVVQREQAVQQREADLTVAEDKLRHTQATSDKTAQTLLAKWDHFRQQESALQERELAFNAQATAIEQDEQMARQKPKGARLQAGPPRRPVLEERK